MFTGLVMGLGRIEQLEARGAETRLSIQALCSLPELVIGESIAVNGACLTVETGRNGRFTAYASAETMQCTNLGALRHGDLVNMERALALGDRLGGHLVSGHVDGVASVVSITAVGQSHRVRLRVDAEQAGEIISKGSVTLDGVSLTVNDCGPDFLEVNVIPETWQTTTMNSWTSGSRINLETDVIGKYVRQMLRPYHGVSAHTATAAKGQVTEAFLRENGFI